jgi:hypothetical protein
MTDWKGWIPAGIDWSCASGEVLWFRLGAYRFDDPYFSDTVTRCARHPLNLAFPRRTPMQALEDAAASLTPANLCGIVFHMSRCGSTLVARALQLLPRAIVISEAPPIDAIVRANRRGRNVRREQQIRWLRAVVAILASAGGSDGGPSFLKTDAWHTLDLELFEHAFPGVPWVYLYRDPVEVLVSHAARMSYMMSFANAPDFLGISLADAAQIPREQYQAQVLGRLVSSLLQRGVDGHALVRYDELPDAVWNTIVPRFGITPNDADIDAMRRMARYNAKQSGVPFSDDRAVKQSLADDAVRSAANALIAHAIRELDEVRCR